MTPLALTLALKSASIVNRVRSILCDLIKNMTLTILWNLLSLDQQLRRFTQL